MNVAIDGPAGAGKSTVAKAVAKEMQFVYVDTGAMYRAIAVYFLINAIDIGDEQACAAVLDNIRVTIAYDESGVQQVILNDLNVSPIIRTGKVGDAASRTSAYGAVRAKLTSLQKELARTSDVVMDGRDIGTVVLPNAEVKIYLTASSRVRAIRRQLEYREKGIEVDLDEVEEEIKERDRRDMTREIAPLRQAEDAVVVDTSDLTVEEVVETILGIIRERAEKAE